MYTKIPSYCSPCWLLTHNYYTYRNCSTYLSSKNEHAKYLSSGCLNSDVLEIRAFKHFSSHKVQMDNPIVMWDCQRHWGIAVFTLWHLLTNREAALNFDWLSLSSTNHLPAGVTKKIWCICEREGAWNRAAWNSCARLVSTSRWHRGLHINGGNVLATSLCLFTQQTIVGGSPFEQIKISFRNSRISMSTDE